MGNKRIENYLSLVCSYIKNKDVHKEVANEIREHIYEIYDEGIESGLSEDAAIDKALKRLGDTYSIGQKLNKVHKAKPDYISFVGALFLAFIGIISIYIIQSSGLVSYNMIIKTLIALGVGIVIVIGLYYFDYRKLEKYSFHIYFLCIGITILALVTSKQVNGMPSNMVTVSLIMLIGFLVSLSGLMNILDLNKIKNIILIFFLAFIPFAILLLTPNLTLALFYAIAFTSIFLLSSITTKYKKIGLIFEGLIAIFTFIFSFLSNSFRIYATFPILAPEEVKKSISLTYLESIKLLESAGLFGKNIAESNSKLSLIHTDFAFPAMVYSLGWIISSIVLVVIAVFILRNLILAKKVKDNFGRSIVLSCTIILMLQFITVILSSLGITSILYAVPFISYGVGNLISNFLILGLLISIYRRKNLKSIKAYNIQ